MHAKAERPRTAGEVFAKRQAFGHFFRALQPKLKGVFVELEQ